MSAETELSDGGDATEEAAGPAVGRRAFVCGAVAAATAAAGAAAGGTAAAQEDPYGGWFEDVGNYEATVDLRGNEEVTVAVGAGEDGVQFEPPAILVDPGATVVWEWTGEGGSHNVVHEPAEEEEEPAFETEITDEEGATFEHTFDGIEEGVFRYFCAPHRSIGMKGAVAVGNVDDELIQPGGDGSGGGGARPLTPTDMLIAGVGLAVGIALVLAVARPGFLGSDRT